MGKRGPKTVEYDAKRHPVIAAALAAQGMIDDQIQAMMGIAKPMYYRWKKRYPEFAAAVTDAKAPVDDSVEKSLLQRAHGYEYEEVEQVGKQVGTDANGKPIIHKDKLRVIKKHVPPDTTACIFWLKNRRPAQWRDVQGREHSGDLNVSVGSFADLAKLVTDDEANAAKL
jgi:transposase